jgi:hypothetical protein
MLRDKKMKSHIVAAAVILSVTILVEIYFYLEYKSIASVAILVLSYLMLMLVLYITYSNDRRTKDKNIEESKKLILEIEKKGEAF